MAKYGYMKLISLLYSRNSTSKMPIYGGKGTNYNEFLGYESVLWPSESARELSRKCSIALGKCSIALESAR